MTPDFNEPTLRFAIQAVRQASLLAKQIQSELAPRVVEKADKSPVTVADFCAQALIGRLFSEFLSDAVLVAEESAHMLAEIQNLPVLTQIVSYLVQIYPEANTERVLQWIQRGSSEPPKTCWTLDPIDGTLGFLRKEQFAVSMAYIYEGKVEIGVLGCPNLRDAKYPDATSAGSLIIAQRGQGSWLTPLSGKERFTQLKVSTTSDFAAAHILRSVENAHTNSDQIGAIAARLGVETPSISMDSQAKYALLASGEGDVMLRLLAPGKADYKEKIWDQAGGSIVLEEAGGRVTDLDGKPLDFSQGRTLTANRGVVATNWLLHEDVLVAIHDIETMKQNGQRTA